MFFGDFMKKSFLFFLAVLPSGLAFSQNNLLVKPEDLRLVPETALQGAELGNFQEIKGYHLFIRKIPGLESVMLTETTKDPSGEADNYASRALEHNDVNGDEVRYLNGKVLDSVHSKFSLVDSTAESDGKFGEAFHIYIPSTIQFGYPWTRNGTLSIGKGTFVNIRAFSKKYADYSGDFFDNPYMFNLGKEKSEPVAKSENKNALEKVENSIAFEPPSEFFFDGIPFLTDDYNPIASVKFAEIANKIVYSKGPSSIIDDIIDTLLEIEPKDKVDAVFVVDATGSMKDDIETIRQGLIPRLSTLCRTFGSLRLGLLLYRDYGSNFRYRDMPVKFFDFTSDAAIFAKNLNGFYIRGNEGGDIPEAVYEGLYGALTLYRWKGDSVKKIILIGDAEPHPVPRGSGKYTKELVEITANEKGVSITAIITPDEKSRRGR